MRMRKGALSVLGIVGALLVPTGVVGAGSDRQQPGADASAASADGGTGEFVVFYEDGVSSADGRAAVARAGGRVVDEISQLGIARVTTDDAGFVAAAKATGEVRSVARNHSVGASDRGAAHRYALERALEDRTHFAPSSAGANRAGAAATSSAKPGPETFSHLQWDMEMIDATPDAAHQHATGEGVLVGIIDTGIDGSHPDLAPNFDASLSRNFTTDIPLIDGPCESEPDGSCSDPATVDEGGHGTHVAGTVAAATNGFGIAGVAPEATLVNLRAGQDSGYFFFFETVAALTYAAENGIDVVNMSFYTDPWLYNCQSESDYVSGDVTDEQIEQQAMIREGLIEAVAHARDSGVTLVGSAGNSATDLAQPTRSDATSPDYPPGEEQPRVVTDNCLDLPAEAPGVVTVSAIGPSTVKSDYSNYGLGVIDIAAPGGWFRDYFGTPDFREPENMILSTYPTDVAREEGAVNKGGGLKDPHFYARDCTDGKPCAYYQYLQGTSMAGPHVAGVVALIIEAFGTPDGTGGYDLAPAMVEHILTSSATPTECPDPELLDYTDEGRPESWNATCVGDAEFNSNYGHGIVNALAATTYTLP